MAKPRFIIKLRKAHLKSGLSAYMVAKKLNLNEGTVRKYATQDVEAEFLPNHVLQLIEFYGLDWRDPDVIEVIHDEDETLGQLKTLLTPV